MPDEANTTTPTAILFNEELASVAKSQFRQKMAG
jgi:hypothetical protein